MSALGQKRTLGHVRVMSALPPKADIGTQWSNVRFVPKADIRYLSNQLQGRISQAREAWDRGLHSIARQDDILQDRINLAFPALSREHPVMADARLHVVAL